MTRLNVMEVRRNFSKTVNRAGFGKERIVLERHGQDVAALVSLEDLQLLEELVEEREDHLDSEAAQKALEEPGSISLEELKRDLRI